MIVVKEAPAELQHDGCIIVGIDPPAKRNMGVCIARVSADPPWAVAHIRALFCVQFHADGDLAQQSFQWIQELYRRLPFNGVVVEAALVGRAGGVMASTARDIAYGLGGLSVGCHVLDTPLFAASNKIIKAHVAVVAERYGFDLAGKGRKQSVKDFWEHLTGISPIKRWRDVQHAFDAAAVALFGGGCISVEFEADPTAVSIIPPEEVMPDNATDE